MKFNIIIFANTIWFLEKFKFSLIDSLTDSFNIKCLYLRTGPPYDEKKIKYLKNKGVVFNKLGIYNVIFITLTRILKLKNNFSNFKPNKILVFTIGPILLTQIIFPKYKRVTIYVLEGLGRLFSSRIIIYRILKRFVIRAYKFIFINSKAVITLNYCDAIYLTEMNITTFDKIITIPGTGFDIPNKIINSENYNPVYIDYVARLISDKGFNLFVYTKVYINKYLPEFAKENPFRIITPQSDIDKLTKREKIFLDNNGIILKPYLLDPIEYYKESKAIVVPTSYAEGISRIVLEAIHFGIPLLVSKNRGTEQLLPADYQYFINSDNPVAIANQLLKMIKNRENCSIKINSQKQIIEKFYSSKSSIEALSVVLKDN